jgi:hypothetical protein
MNMKILIFSALKCVTFTCKNIHRDDRITECTRKLETFLFCLVIGLSVNQATEKEQDKNISKKVTPSYNVI